MKKIALISSICLLTDQLSKLILEHLFALNQTTSIIPSFFAFTYVKNEGAAWSILAGNQVFLILISIASIFLLYHFFIKNKKTNMIENISYGLLFGGIFGNLIDRIIRGYVVDFFDFTIFNYHFPVFNIADICIVIGVLLLMIQIWKGETHENRSRQKPQTNRSISDGNIGYK